MNWGHHRIPALVVFCLSLFAALNLSAGPLPGNHWELLTIVYPVGREVTVSLGGGEKNLLSKGLGTVKWRKDVATLEIEIKNLPAASEAGWTGRQYVLWAIDRDKRAINLGLVPTKGKDAKWKVHIPLRIFGLLVTAESDPKATTPADAVAVESLLPTNTDLVIPVYKVDLALVPPKS